MKNFLLAGALLAQALGATAAGAATATVNRDFRFEAAPPAALAVDNLVGDVRIEPAAAGAGFEIDVEVTAEADARADAEAIARAVEFRQQDGGREASLQVVLPEDRFPRIYRAGAPTGWLSGRCVGIQLPVFPVEAEKRYRRALKHRLDFIDHGGQVVVDVLARAHPRQHGLDDGAVARILGFLVGLDLSFLHNR